MSRILTAASVVMSCATVIALPATGAGSAHPVPQLLARVPTHFELTMDVALDSPYVEYFKLRIESGAEDWYELTTGPWGPGETGTTAFTEGDLGFAEVARELTNTENTLIVRAVGAHWRPGTGSTWVTGTYESPLFGSPNPLIGAEISNIEVAVESLVFEQLPGSGAILTTDITWSVYGAVPEPAIGAALVLLIALWRPRGSTLS